MKALRRSAALDRMYVYALVHPVTFVPFYVGRALDPAARLAKHLRDARLHSGVPVKAYTKRLILAKQRPQMCLLEVTTFAGIDAAERKWITHFRQQFDVNKNVLLIASEEP